MLISGRSRRGLGRVVSLLDLLARGRKRRLRRRSASALSSAVECLETRTMLHAVGLFAPLDTGIGSPAVAVHDGAATGQTQAESFAGPTGGIDAFFASGARATLDWDDLSGADRYEVIVYSVTAGQEVAHQTALSESAFTTAPLTGPDTYQAFVRGTTGDGRVGSWSSPVHFEFARPPRPNFTGGPNGSTSQITWTAVAGAASYELLVYSTTAGQEVLREAGLTATAHTPTELLDAADDYQAFVRATGASGQPTGWSIPLFFTIEGASRASSTPVLAATSTHPPRITWSAVSNAQSYELLIYSTSRGQEVLRVADLTETAYTPAPLLSTTDNYEVFVRARNGSGRLSPWGGPATFRIDNNPTFPAAPSFTSVPGHDSPTLAWTTVAGAAAYEVQLYSVSQGRLLMRQTSLSGTQFDVSAFIQTPDRYEAHVRPFNFAGVAGNWASPLQFTITAAPAGTPGGGTSPGGGTTTNPGGGTTNPGGGGTSGGGGTTTPGGGTTTPGGGTTTPGTGTTTPGGGTPGGGFGNPAPDALDATLVSFHGADRAGKDGPMSALNMGLVLLYEETIRGYTPSHLYSPQNMQLQLQGGSVLIDVSAAAGAGDWVQELIDLGAVQVSLTMPTSGTAGGTGGTSTGGTSTGGSGNTSTQTGTGSGGSQGDPNPVTTPGTGTVPVDGDPTGETDPVDPGSGGGGGTVEPPPGGGGTGGTDGTVPIGGEFWIPIVSLDDLAELTWVEDVMPVYGFQTVDEWAIGLWSGSDPAAVAAALGVGSLTPTGIIPNSYTFTVSNGQNVAELVEALDASESVAFYEPLISQELVPFLIPTDPLFDQQWHLRNTGQTGGTPGVDANVTSVWDQFTGDGVVIGIVDDGLQHEHPEFTARYEPRLSFDFLGNDPDPSSAADPHGTAVAGVAAAGFNGIGVVGAAFDARLAGLRLIGAGVTDPTTARAISHRSQEIDIYNNSWGEVTMGGLSPVQRNLFLAALRQGTTVGRGGLGSIYVFAAGNDRARFFDNTNYSQIANSRFVITVGAIGHDGIQASYSEPGASLLVVAPSLGDVQTFADGIVTTDNLGADGYNTAAGGADGDPLPDLDYTSTFSGTSSSAPLVSGVIALMLDANPNLTWRDVKHILVHSARMTDPTDPGWFTNGAGLLFNHNYGFGAIDAAAAVNLARGWTSVAPAVVGTTGQMFVNRAIPDFNPAGIGVSTTVQHDITIETVEIVVNAIHPFRGDLKMVLVSPSGTRSVLAESRAIDAGAGFTNWIFSSNAHWGENSAGTWTLEVADESAVDTGVLVDWQLNFHGTGTPFGQLPPWWGLDV